jgi:hypothetical protein
MRGFGIVLLLLAVGLAAAFAGRRSAVAEVEYCLSSPVTIVASGPGTVYGTGGQDVILADQDGTAQTIRALGGNDKVCAGTGDVVYGGSGDDFITAFFAAALYGESGSDNIGAFGVGTVSGGSGDDWVGSGGNASGELLGGAGNDSLVANGINRCDGGSGTDVIELFNSGCTTIVSVP